MSDPNQDLAEKTIGYAFDKAVDSCWAEAVSWGGLTIKPSNKEIKKALIANLAPWMKKDLDELEELRKAVGSSPDSRAEEMNTEGRVFNENNSTKLSQTHLTRGMVKLIEHVAKDPDIKYEEDPLLGYHFLNEPEPEFGRQSGNRIYDFVPELIEKGFENIRADDGYVASINKLFCVEFGIPVEKHWDGGRCIWIAVLDFEYLTLETIDKIRDLWWKDFQADYKRYLMQMECRSD